MAGSQATVLITISQHLGTGFSSQAGASVPGSVEMSFLVRAEANLVETGILIRAQEASFQGPVERSFLILVEEASFQVPVEMSFVVRAEEVSLV